VAISVDHLPALTVMNAALARFPFPLAADWHRGICRGYGVLDEQKQAARRVLMLFDREGSLRQILPDIDPTQPDLLEPLFETARTLH